MPSILLSCFRYESRGESTVLTYTFALPSVVGCGCSVLRAGAGWVLDCHIISSAHPTRQIAFMDMIYTDINIKTRSRILMPWVGCLIVRGLIVMG
ncbi:hypothetical protein BDN71DRAFT_196833 [Pleurotus eryngii]|uniref:Uncharacterized protein n=1 Tax=Pleurotus eryngii TaxID=5323 RepID=A0A9P5ZLR5_PLEER|nr:hypothetical protein BDN71DRAFT_196833 [Pleurotus eryngii]